MTASRQKLPAAGPLRAALRAKGQFWTPDWVADAMIAYAAGKQARVLFDPAVGAGAFFRAAKRYGLAAGHMPRLRGTEIDPATLREARAQGVTDSELCGVTLADFLASPPTEKFPAIVANPPYLRHHRMSAELKAQLRDFSVRLIGRPIDGRAGGHIFFLLRALSLLEEGGRLAFIMPADTCEGIFAPVLWNWITREFRLDALIAFAAVATPFPGVDTNALIFLIEHAAPRETFFWARCETAATPALQCWIAGGFAGKSDANLTIYRRTLAEALQHGLSRAPHTCPVSTSTLGQFAKVLRGIATGANDFFFLTRAQAKALKIPAEFLLPAIGRTRDIHEEIITTKTLDALDAAGRPTLLFSPDGRPLHEYSKPVRDYLQHGEELGLPQCPLIASRKPWYKMERRAPPPLLFAYLGRRNVRFIKNEIGVMPLTGFLCVYPLQLEVSQLWAALRHPETIANLRLVGKSYGSGCIKVEPRALERLPLAMDNAVAKVIKPPAFQLPLFFPDVHTQPSALLIRESALVPYGRQPPLVKKHIGNKKAVKRSNISRTKSRHKG